MPDGLGEISHKPTRNLHEQQREHGFEQNEPRIKQQHRPDAGGEVEKGENGIKQFLIFVAAPLGGNSKTQQRNKHGNAEKIDNAVEKQANHHQHPPLEGDKTQGGEDEGGGHGTAISGKGSTPQPKCEQATGAAFD